MTPNASGRRNRVAPDGTTAAAADRGLFWGNRGRLLSSRGEVARHSQGRNWIICLLEFHGRHRMQWQPNRLTELYFLDEATALAAGHRPCGECRHADLQRFKRAWTRAHGTSPTADEIDRRLHGERLVDARQLDARQLDARQLDARQLDARQLDARHRTHRLRQDELPDGVVVRDGGELWLVLGERIHRWTFGGYDAARPRRTLPARVDVCTPPATVAVLGAGYAPVVHSSATHP